MSKLLLSLLIALSLTPVSGFAALVDNIKAYYPLSDTTDSTGNGNTLTNTSPSYFSSNYRLCSSTNMGTFYKRKTARPSRSAT